MSVFLWIHKAFFFKIIIIIMAGSKFADKKTEIENALNYFELELNQNY